MNSGIVIVTRDDFYPFCKKVPFNLVSYNEHIDINRMRGEGKLERNEIHNTKYVIFIDDDGSEKVILDRKNKS